MRLALQIFRKDFERLWWVVLLTLALLAVFAFEDASPNGGWLNLALPFAWSLLIALVINQDPLAGDRQFWVSLPCGWRPLLAAKAAFIVAYIQIPYLIATAEILIAGGLSPLEHIPHLLWKQLVLLTFILPAVAIAAVVKNIAQFLLVTITIAGGLILLSNSINRGYSSGADWDVRWDITLITLAAGALASAIVQFVRRDTPLSRQIGITTVLVALSLHSHLSRDTSAAIRAALFPVRDVAPIAVTLGSEVPSVNEQRRYYNFGLTSVLIPIRLSGLSSRAKLDQVGLKLSSGGERYEAQWGGSSNAILRQRINAGLDMYNGSIPTFQWLRLGNPEIVKQLLSGPVTIEGRILARFYKLGRSTTLHAGAGTKVPGLGYCTASQAALGRESGTVTLYACDSTEVTAGEMFSYGNPRALGRGLGMFSYYPQDPWLSPLYRATIRGRKSAEVVPVTSLGYQIIDYTFRDVDLNQFLVREALP